MKTPTKHSFKTGQPPLLAVALAGMAALAAAASFRVAHRYDADGRLATSFYDCGGTNAALLLTYDAAGNRAQQTTIAAHDDAFDADGDDFGDLGELRYFGHLDQTGADDPDGDGLVNSNELASGGSPLQRNTDGDPHDDYQEWVAGTSSADSNAYFRITGVSMDSGSTLHFLSVPNRVYTLYHGAQPNAGVTSPVPGQVRVPGLGGAASLTDDHPPAQRFYRVGVDLP